MLPVYKLKQQQKTRNTTCTKFLRQNKNTLTMSQSRWLNNFQTQRHMQPIPFLSKSLGESAWTTRLRNHDGNIYRLVSAFNCRLNVAGLNPLGYNFSFWVLSWKVMWTAGKLHPPADATKTTTTSFSEETKYLKRPENFFQGIPVSKFKWPENFFQGIPVPKLIQRFSKYAFSDPSIFPRIQAIQVTVDTLF